MFNHMQALMPKFFPQNETKNLTICIPYKFTGEFSAIVTDITPDLHVIAANQCFPLHVYDNGETSNITDATLSVYRAYYGTKAITKMDIFCYVYAMLHHHGFKQKFASNLNRELPRIPMVPTLARFTKFRVAGQDLIVLHLSFDTCKRHDLGTPKIRPPQVLILYFPNCRSAPRMWMQVGRSKT